MKYHIFFVKFFITMQQLSWYRTDNDSKEDDVWIRFFMRDGSFLIWFLIYWFFFLSSSFSFLFFISFLSPQYFFELSFITLNYTLHCTALHCASHDFKILHTWKVMLNNEIIWIWIWDMFWDVFLRYVFEVCFFHSPGINYITSCYCLFLLLLCDAW
jgi:hypothetical protein